jgi:hypothetical protein
MHERFGVSENFRRDCALLAESLWQRYPHEDVVELGKRLFPRAKPDYVQSLIGEHIASEAKFVYEYYAQKNVLNPTTRQPYSLKDFERVYQERRRA